MLLAMRSLRIAPQAALQANSTRPASTQESQRTRSLMAAARVACTVVLLIVTSLALRSFSHLLHQNRGFESDHVTLAQVDLFAQQYGDFSSTAKYREAESFRPHTGRSRSIARRAVGNPHQRNASEG
jgi:hypothetical protein